MTILHLRILSEIVHFFNPSGCAPVWGLVPERGVLKGEASNLRGANLMMSNCLRGAVKNYLADILPKNTDGNEPESVSPIGKNPLCSF